jgi:TPR repeat protein
LSKPRSRFKYFCSQWPSFEAGAERGDPDSHFNLGALHASGLGVCKAYPKYSFLQLELQQL